MMSQGKGSRLLVCQDAWADQGDESELHFVADVVLKITVFVFHNSLLVRGRFAVWVTDNGAGYGWPILVTDGGLG